MIDCMKMVMKIGKKPGTQKKSTIIKNRSEEKYRTRMHTLSHNMKNKIIGLKYKREIQGR